MAEAKPTLNDGKPVKPRRQLINVIHHNKAMYHERWFGKGQCVLFVEKIHMPDGRTVKKVVAKTKDANVSLTDEPKAAPVTQTDVVKALWDAAIGGD